VQPLAVLLPQGGAGGGGKAPLLTEPSLHGGGGYFLLPCGHPLSHPARPRASTEHPFFLKPGPAPAMQCCSGATRRRSKNRTAAEPPAEWGPGRRSRLEGSLVNAGGGRSPQFDTALPTGSRQSGVRRSLP